MQQLNKIKPKHISALFLGTVLLHLFLDIFVSIITTKFTSSLVTELILSEMGIMVPGLLFLLIYNLPIAENLGFKKIKTSTFFMTILLTELISPLVALTNLLSQLFTDNEVAKMADNIFELNFFLMAFIIGIFGPFCEEFIFRGIVFNGFRKYGSIIGSALVSGLFFGLLHMNLNQFMYAFLLGVIFGIINSASGSIWTSIIMHCVINTQNVVLMYGLEVLYKLLGMDMSVSNVDPKANGLIYYSIGLYLILALVFTAISLPVFGFIAKNEGNQDIYHHLKDRPEGGSKIWWLDGFFAVSVAICVALIFALEPILKLIGLS